VREIDVLIYLIGMHDTVQFNNWRLPW